MDEYGNKTDIRYFDRPTVCYMKEADGKIVPRLIEATSRWENEKSEQTFSCLRTVQTQSQTTYTSLRGVTQPRFQLLPGDGCSLTPQDTDRGGIGIHHWHRRYEWSLENTSRASSRAKRRNRSCPPTTWADAAWPMHEHW